MSELIRQYHNIRRHDDKDKEGKLSAAGAQNALLTGSLLQGDLLQIYSSPISRAIASAGFIWAGKYPAITPNITQVEALAELNPPVPEGMTDRTAIFDHWMKEEYRYGGPMLLAGTNVTNFVARNIHNIGPQNGKRKDGTIEYITHAPNIESALITIADPRMRTMDEIGGYFRAGEGFTIVADINKGTNKLVQAVLQYRGKNVNFSSLDTFNWMTNVGPFD